MRKVVEYLPERLRNICLREGFAYDLLQEIRIHKEGCLSLVVDGKHIVPNGEYIVDSKEFCDTLELLTNSSLYSFEDEIKKGYFTLKEGHRVGVAGQVLMENQQIKTMRNITSLNIRVAHEKKGCAKELMPELMEENELMSTLLVASPGGGKTTLLRDLVRIIASEQYQYNVSLVDERSEVAGCYKGIPSNDVGMNCSVLDSCDKALGIEMLLRSMTPDVIAVDEIGQDEDVKAIHKAFCQGVKIIASAHGNSFEDVQRQEGLKDLLGTNGFARVVVLAGRKNPGCIKNVIRV